MAVKEIIEFTITTDDPEGYLPHVTEEIASGYRAGQVDSENFWESKVIGYSEEDKEEV